MEIAIIGTGAIGGFYGILLADGGHHVHFLLRSDYEHVKESGLELISNKKPSVRLKQVNVYNDSALLPRVDIAIVAMKTTENNRSLIEILDKLRDSHPIIVLVQNGLGMEEDLSSKFPELDFVSGVALIAVTKTSPGTIVHQDYGNLDFGIYGSKSDYVKINKLSKALIEIGIPSHIGLSSHLRWKKLVWNMAFNGISVIHNKSTSEILIDKIAFARLRKIMNEVVVSAQKIGVDISGNFVNDMIEFTRKMEAYHPSMKVDFDHNREMELEYMYQRPLEIARNAGTPMFETEKLYRELLKIQPVIE